MQREDSNTQTDIIRISLRRLGEDKWKEVKEIKNGRGIIFVSNIRRVAVFIEKSARLVKSYKNKYGWRYFDWCDTRYNLDDIYYKYWEKEKIDKIRQEKETKKEEDKKNYLKAKSMRLAEDMTTNPEERKRIAETIYESMLWNGE